MKTSNLSLLAVLIVFIAGTVHAALPNTKIYYINGIQNSVQQANEGALAAQSVLAGLTDNTRVNLMYNPIGMYSGSQLNGCVARSFTGNFYSYFPTTGEWISFAATEATKMIGYNGCIAQDLGELAISKINEENYFDAYQDFVLVNSAATPPNTITAKAASFIATYLPNEKETIRRLVDSYAQVIIRDVNSGKKVLLVAHSQGNIVVNLTWVKVISQLTPAQLGNIRILNVANTHRSSPHGADITHTWDFEIRTFLPALGKLHFRNTPACVQVLPSPLAANTATNNCTFLVVNATYRDNVANALFGPESKDNHNFVATYLSGYPVTRDSDNQITTFANAFYAHAATLLQSMGAIAAPNAPPLARFTASPSSVTVNQLVAFDGSASSDVGGNIIAYAWNFGDNSPAVSSASANTSHQYSVAGTYTATLTVTDNQGATHAVSRVVTVSSAVSTPVVNSITPITATVNTNTTFTVSGGALPLTAVIIFPNSVCAEATAHTASSFIQVCSLTTVGAQPATVMTAAVGGTAVGAPITVNVSTSAAPQPNNIGLLNDTGINSSQCYSVGSNTLVSCTSDAAIALSATQDGMIGRDISNSNGADGKLGFSYTKIGSTGANLAATATNWDCVKDNVTGRMWENKNYNASVPLNLRDATKTYTNYGDGRAGDASQFVTQVNAIGLCGYSDWRLPSVDELQQIVDYGQNLYLYSIDTNWFSNTKPVGYITSDRFIGAGLGVGFISFIDGNVGYTYPSTHLYARLMR